MIKKIYESPAVEEVSLVSGGVLCQSNPVLEGNFYVLEDEDDTWL